MSNITLPVSELKPALAGLGKIIGRASSLPILKMVRIERSADGWITLKSTDLETFITVRLEEPTQGKPVQILVAHDDLTRITKRCQKNESLVLSKTDGDKALVQFPIGNQMGQEHLASLPSAEFPEVLRVKGNPIPILDDLRQSLLEAFQCASADPTRVVLNGAYLDVSNRKSHHVISTDGRHLYDTNSFSTLLAKSILIPHHKFLEWKEFNSDGEWQLAVNDDPALLQINSRRWTFTTRQIEGNYPNWRQVIPDHSKAVTTLELSEKVTETILALVPRIPCHDVVNNTVGLVVGGKKLMIRGRGNNDTKWTDLDVEGVSVKGKPVTIYLNRHFITKALRFGMTTIDIIDSLSPMRFSAGGKQMIVMPVRGQEPQPAGPQPKPTEENGNGSATSVTFEADKPASNEAQPERNATMPKSINRVPTNGNGHHDQPTETKPAIEVALDKIETIKGSYREAIRGLNELTDILKQVQRDQKNTVKEVQSVRTTLEKLQQVRI